jgi:3'(2'), 5'-bisphosphate nucleotidase
VTPAERRTAAVAILAMAREAARLVADVYAHPFDVEYKAKNDPVTAADRASNAFLCEAIAARFPGIPIVAEESDPATYEGFHHAVATFFVDPLDGTRDFVNRNGEFAVMVGLAEGGRPTLGDIVEPAHHRAFVGGDGVEAVLHGPGGPEPLRVSRTRALTEAEIVVSRSRHTRSVEVTAASLGVRKVTPCGSAGVKAMRVASGEADAYPQTGRAGALWDSCAPEAIVTAAGGRFTDAHGAPFDYRSPHLDLSRGLLASNGELHDSMLQLLREAEG